MAKTLWTLDGDIIAFRSQCIDNSDIVLKVKTTTYARRLAYEFVEMVDCDESEDEPLFFMLCKALDKTFKKLARETRLYCKLSGNSTFSKMNAVATKNILIRELRKEFDRIDVIIKDALKDANYNRDKCWDSIRDSIYSAWESSDNKD